MLKLNLFNILNQRKFNQWKIYASVMLVLFHLFELYNQYQQYLFYSKIICLTNKTNISELTLMEEGTTQRIYQ
jgi:hypothetical protein